MSGHGGIDADPVGKTAASDLVTETDKAVEDMVSTALRAEYPDYVYLFDALGFGRG